MWPALCQVVVGRGAGAVPGTTMSAGRAALLARSSTFPSRFSARIIQMVATKVGTWFPFHNSFRSRYLGPKKNILNISASTLYHTKEQAGFRGYWGRRPMKAPGVCLPPTLGNLMFLGHCISEMGPHPVHWRAMSILFHTSLLFTHVLFSLFSDLIYKSFNIYLSLFLCRFFSYP